MIKSIIKTINDLDLKGISIEKIECQEYPEEIIYVTINGGFNSCSENYWSVYLKQINTIITQFKDCIVIDLHNDVLDDIWTLKLAIINK